jgi:hypothetical protein
MSQNRRERRRLQRELKKVDPTNSLNEIITSEMGAEIRRRYLQKLKNEQIETQEVSDSEYTPSSLNLAPPESTYGSFKNLVIKRDWDSVSED